MWALLKRNVNKENCNTVDELWDVIVDEWEQIPISFINSLYESIPRRLKALIKNRGEHSKY